jgi:hypothetical protein
MVSIAVQSG